MKYTVLEATDWWKKPSNLPCRIIITHLPNNVTTPFTTHLELIQEGKRSLLSGDYCLSLKEVLISFKERCELYESRKNIKEFPYKEEC